MPRCFDPRFEVLPPAQIEIWEHLRPAAGLGFALYGGTAIALQLGHRRSVDFDFFSAAPLNKTAVRAALPFVLEAQVEQDEPNTLVVLCSMPSGRVKVSFFGQIRFGRVNDPMQTRDSVMLVASLDDLMATKLKTILDRAEMRDYRDLAALLDAGVSLPRALAAFRTMFHGEPRTALTAIGYFGDGDISSLTPEEKRTLTNARDLVRELPDVAVRPGSLVIELGECD
jgi:hypothetical protein